MGRIERPLSRPGGLLGPNDKGACDVVPVVINERIERKRGIVPKGQHDAHGATHSFGPEATALMAPAEFHTLKVGDAS